MPAHHRGVHPPPAMQGCLLTSHASPRASIPRIAETCRLGWRAASSGLHREHRRSALVPRSIHPRELSAARGSPAGDQRTSRKPPRREEGNFLGLFLIDRADGDPHWVYLGFHNWCHHIRLSPQGHRQPPPYLATHTQTQWSSGGTCVSHIESCLAFIPSRRPSRALLCVVTPSRLLKSESLRESWVTP